MLLRTQNAKFVKLCIIQIFGYLAIWLRAKNVSMQGIPEKGIPEKCSSEPLTLHLLVTPVKSYGRKLIFGNSAS